MLLAQEEEIQQLIARFEAQAPQASAVAQLEILVRTAVFKSANELVGCLLQQAAERVDAHYQPKPGERRKGLETIRVQGIFGSFDLSRDYYYHAGKDQGHYPSDAALGLEVGYTPTSAKLVCLEGADEPTYLEAERHLEQTGGAPRTTHCLWQLSAWRILSHTRGNSPPCAPPGASAGCQ